MGTETKTAGYSGTPLAKKLGIKEGARLYVLNAPADYRGLLEPLPSGVTFSRAPSARTDLAHLFTTRRRDLERHLATLRGTLADTTPVWVSWPKKSARLPTDVTEDTIRAVALPMGFVDIKVCAVSEVWSGLKLVVRKELRAKAT
jgi:bifunctional DNA-binding transcriptional regulator/antitoxin component of YhaV-PrlF toxin-antitoxin module